MKRLVPVLATAALVAAASSAFADTMMKTPALDGYCPVAYVAAGKPVKGDPKFSTDHNGELFYFVNADAKKAFDANPEMYAVAYGGWCATAGAVNQRVKSDPTIFEVKDGVTYLFSSADAKKAFDAEPMKFAWHPQYGGWCATAMAMGKEVPADPALFTAREGKVYVFSSADAKTAFDNDAAMMIPKADAAWSKLMKDMKTMKK